MLEHAINIAITSMVLLVPLLCSALLALVLKRYGIERLRKIREQYDQKQGWAYAGVKAAQQLYGANHGQEKYRYATDWLAARAREHHIPIAAEEIRGMIEAAVKACRVEFGKAWAEADDDASGVR